MRAYAIVTGDDPDLLPLDFNHSDNYDYWKAKEAEAAFMIRFACSPEVQCITKGMRNLFEMWNTLENSLDTIRSYIRRQDWLGQLRTCRPKEDDLLKAYFTKHTNYHIQLHHTNDGITDREFHTQILTSQPSQCLMLSRVLNIEGSYKHRKKP